jgi:hypothetical protein
MKKLGSLALLVFVIAACGSKKADRVAPDDKSPPPAAAAKVAEPAAAALLSCTNPSSSQCTEFPDGDAGLVKQQCDMINGKLATAACAQKGRVGGCDLTGMHKRITYYGGGDDNLTSASAKQDCTAMSGGWQP